MYGLFSAASSLTCNSTVVRDSQHSILDLVISVFTPIRNAESKSHSRATRFNLATQTLQHTMVHNPSLHARNLLKFEYLRNRVGHLDVMG
jgi:hypothetical protein